MKLLDGRGDGRKRRQQGDTIQPVDRAVIGNAPQQAAPQQGGYVRTKLRRLFHHSKAPQGFNQPQKWRLMNQAPQQAPAPQNAAHSPLVAGVMLLNKRLPQAAPQQRAPPAGAARSVRQHQKQPGAETSASAKLDWLWRWHSFWSYLIKNV